MNAVRGPAKRPILPRRVLWMAVLWAAALWPASAPPAQAAEKLPESSGFVNDFAGVMEAADKRALEALAAALEEKTGAELAVVTVDSYAPYASLDDYALALAESWGIGKKGEDNGVLLILAMQERRVKIEVGYGLEGAIPDSAAGRILDTALLPDFRRNDFSGGLVKGAEAIAAAVAREKGLDPAELNLSAPAEEAPQDREGGALSLIITLCVVFFIWPLLTLPLRRRRRRGFPVIFNSGAFRSGGFGSSGGFGGGGFGGFGGGGFGGGGASRGF